jgi:hypothetical protein
VNYWSTTGNLSTPSREFKASEFEGLLPVTTIPGTGINVTEGIQQLGGLLDAVSP